MAIGIRSAEPTERPFLAKTSFDAYIMVDWSSSGRPARRANSIWIGWGWRDGRSLKEDYENTPTRSQAIQRIRDLLSTSFADKRVLLGFDFAFGYPKGFAKALGLEVESRPPWRAIFDEFANGVRDGDDNRHNRDEFAARCNSLISGGPGPFWGCHRKFAEPNLTTNRVGVFEFSDIGLEEYRETELRARKQGSRALSVWKINQGVAVGGQTIMGIKRLAELRFESEKLEDRLAIWPFETGWSIPNRDNQVVIAEIFPSVIPIEIGLSTLTRDLAQVLSCARHAARLDAAGELAARFGPPLGLDDAALRVAAEEEGWILFVR